ncbi:MAG: hypothetical protein E5V65_02780 [Mesorhizobium sp.]|nr:MAG: hypothetical protein E5V65_02780 [Mesorhizobium sp.]
MNRLPLPDFFDDHAALQALSQNARVNSHPHLQPHVDAIRAGYQQYVAVAGNATMVQAIPLPDEIGGYLLGHYNSPNADLHHIKEIRSRSEVSTCPMCGSLHSGTLDHLLPKTAFPAFSIFGLNLVPACKCNGLRSTHLIGANPGERILHPYFDDVLEQRLIAVRFTELGPVPLAAMRVLLDTNDPRFAAVAFHVRNVVERTGVLRFMSKSWATLIRRPGLLTVDLSVDPVSREELQEILQNELTRCDGFHESRNNWLSMFVAGLLDDDVLDWLYDQFSRPGRQANDPLVNS